MICSLTSRLFASHASPWVLFVRLATGLVFLPEGIQKIIHPDLLGAGRFLKMGIPSPELMGPFVGWVEIICGTLILLGLFTRVAVIPPIITMLVAITATKIPVWMGHDWAITDTVVFHVCELKTYGFWSFMHETRLDWAMLMCLSYMLAVGAGRWSLDRHIAVKCTPHDA